MNGFITAMGLSEGFWFVEDIERWERDFVVTRAARDALLDYAPMKGVPLWVGKKKLAGSAKNFRRPVLETNSVNL
jgi:hypothetical protein